LKLILSILFLSVTVLVATGIASVQMDIPIPAFTKDVSAIGGLHPLCGVLSSLGILLWCVASSASGIGALAIKGRVERRRYLFLLCSALLSAYLLFDDLFLVHEDLSRRVGLHENIVYLILGLGVASYVIYFRKTLLRSRVTLFFGALAFLSASVLADKIAMPSLVKSLGDWQYLVEDGLKWIGILFWACYYVVTSIEMVRETYNP